MVSMVKSLVSSESLMVFILDPSYTIRFVPFWKELIFLYALQAMVEPEQLSI